MLFGRKKYSYINMAILYIKLVPNIAITKVIYNLIYSLIPTFNILITAMFLDRAILVVNGNNGISEVILPLSLIIAMRLFNYYMGIIMGLISVRTDNKLKSIIVPEIAEKKARIKFRYYENQDNIEAMNRAMDGFAGNIQGFFDQIFNIWNIAAQIIGFLFILGFQLWWAPILFIATSIPSFIISYKFGKKRYDVDKDMAKIDRKAWYITGILTSRDTIEERYMYGYADKMNDDYKAKYETSWKARKKVTKSLWVNTTTSGMLTFASGIIVVAVLLFSFITSNTSDSTMSIGLFISLVGSIIGVAVLGLGVTVLVVFGKKKKKTV